MSKKNKKSKADNLPALVSKCRVAPAVYLAVLGLANGKRQLSKTRRSIGYACGLGERMVGQAVAALHEAGWLHRGYGRHGTRTWYRLNLPKNPLSLWSQKRTTGKSEKGVPCGRKNAPQGKRMNARNHTTGEVKKAVPCGREIIPHSLERVRGGLQPPPPDAGAGAGASTPKPMFELMPPMLDQPAVPPAPGLGTGHDREGVTHV